MLLKLVIKGTLRTRRLSLALSLRLISLSSFNSSIFHNSVTARMEKRKQLRELKTLSP